MHWFLNAFNWKNISQVEKHSSDISAAIFNVMIN